MQSKNISFGTLEDSTTDAGVGYPCSCGDCGFTGTLWYDLVFSCFTDENGDEIATLLGITSDGVIELWNGVNSNLGFELDNNNRIKTENL